MPLFRSSLGLVACLAFACQADFDSAPSAENADTIDSYAKVILECRSDISIGESITEESDEFSDLFSASVETVDEPRELRLQGDLLRIFAPEDNKLWVELSELTITADSLFLLFARTPGTETFRPVSIPIDIVHQDVRINDAIPYVHWFSVVRGFDQQTHAPRADAVSGWGRRLNYDDADLGKDGLLFWGVPWDWETEHLPKFGDESVSLFNQAYFVPFERIPALADIAHEPLEWGLLGAARNWGLGDFDPDILASFTYDIVAYCPESGCQSLPTDSSLENCGLPEYWSP